jgi:ATP-binding cassette subfamily C (CFTR/MRP) protein 1
VAPLLTVLATTVLSTWLGKYMRARQLLWSAATQTRVTAISYVVARMKGVRMLGLSNTVLSMLTTLRELEVAAHKYIRKIRVWVLLISNVMFQMTTLTTYVTFAIITLSKRNGTGFNFDVLYGSLSALKLVTSPLALVLQLIPSMQTSLASLERIEVFLKGGFIEHESVSDIGRDSSSEGIELLRMETDRPPAPVVTMHNATFAVDKQPLLLDVTTEFQPGTLTMVIGKVGSGKSLLLRSLAGETKLISGLFVAPTAGTAFCDQAVWLRNATIHENIIGEAVLDEAWYVAHGCRTCCKLKAVHFVFHSNASEALFGKLY